ncbi:hypothetical protein GCM10010205_60760 [Streptomyces nojiriensis]|nr:hypothetical protein GCM10010205_60760 [Streptomyces nojiriensis]
MTDTASRYSAATARIAATADSVVGREGCVMIQMMPHGTAARRPAPLPLNAAVGRRIWCERRHVASAVTPADA